MGCVRQRWHVLSASALSRLAVRLMEFNVHVARFAHSSWLPDPSGRVDPRAEPRMSEWLLHELDLDRAMDWEMSEPQKRLWLLDGPSLRRLAQELALAMHREWLLQVIDGARLRALKTSVDERAMRFVIEDVPAGQCHHRSPTVNLETDSSADLGRKLEASGARTLMALLQPDWRAVRARAQLHFDRSQNLSDVTPLEGAHCDQALELIGTWLVPRRFPEWVWCF